MQFLTRCTSGSFISSRIRRSISMSSPLIVSSIFLPFSRERSRTILGRISSREEKGNISTFFMSSSRLFVMPPRARLSRSADLTSAVNRVSSDFMKSLFQSRKSSNLVSDRFLCVASSFSPCVFEDLNFWTSGFTRAHSLLQESNAVAVARKSSTCCDDASLAESISSDCSSTDVSLAVETLTVSVEIL